jgi:DNA-binding NarL/FixJ family response regulator
MTTTTSILLVDDHPMLRKGLRLLIESDDGLTVVGESNDGQEAIDRVSQLTPYIVVMDINMPNLNGIEATRRILAESPQTRILALSIHSGRHYVENMLEAGAVGYLLKESAPEELIKALHVIGEGKSYLCAEITEIVLSRLRQGPQTGETASATSDRLASKLQRPHLATSIVHRSQLIQHLQAGCEKKLTLVTAPAGYGKTTLVSDWLARCDTPHAWLSLDKADNHLHLFLESLLASIHTIFPEACPNFQQLSEAANIPPTAILLAALTKDLKQVPHRFILTIDDYHLIEDKRIHNLLDQLLMQSSTPMHLVLISSRDPFLALPTLLTNNDINEIRGDFLLFSAMETTAFLEQTYGQKIDQEKLSAWMERTRGWTTSSQLTASNLTDLGMTLGSVSSEPDVKVKESEGLSDWREILTNREYEVLLLLEQRQSDKEISDQLGISLETVKTHTKHIREKLNANSRRDAVSKAIALNIM